MARERVACARWDFAWIALGVVIASLPAWSGSWIYDDWTMANSPLMDGVDDLAQAFTRTSADYLGTNPTSTFAGVTYRPLSAASLIAVQALVPQPLLHHLLSLGLHLFVLCALFTALSRIGERRFAILLCALFGLHPSTVEAYGWINGRSDVLAGAGLVMLAVGLTRPSGTRATLLWLFSGTLVAGLAKETGFVACAVLICAWILPERGLPTKARLHDMMLPSAAVFAGACAALAPRFMLAKLSSMGSPDFASDLGSPTLLSRLFGVAAESMFIPIPRSMLGLAWELEQPISAQRSLLLALVGLAWLATLATGHFRAAALWAGALLVISPCTVVRHAGLWLGFDRYLYLPGILGCLALASSSVGHRVGALPTRAFAAVCAVVALVLGASTFATSGAYANQTTFVQSMLRLRPDDPTGYIYAAAWTWDPRDPTVASERLSHLRPELLPPGLALQLATLFRSMGRSEQELNVMTELEARNLSDPYVLRRIAAAHLDHGELAQALSVAAKLRNHPPAFCRAFVALLERDLVRARFKDPAEQRAAEAFARAPACVRKGQAR